MKHSARISILAAVLCAFSAATAHGSGAIDSRLDDLLAARGLIGGAIGHLRAPERLPQPAAGVPVTAIAAKLAKSGEEAARAELWQEQIADRTVDFMVTTAPRGQTMAQYWVLRRGGGCDVYVSAVYSKDGRLVTEDFWRNDPQSLRVPGAPEFPPDLFPGFGAPISAFFDSLEALREGAAGKVEMQQGPYDFIVLDTWIEGFEKIDSPAGTFDTVKVVMRPDLDSILKTWPRMFRKMALPFTPKDYFYFNRKPPHQMVKFDGTIGYPAPTLAAHMIGTYIAGPQGAPPAQRGTLEDALAARGLFGGVMADWRAARRMPQPPAGTTVDEVAITLSSTHEPMTQYRIWHEPLGAYTLEVQESTMPSGQTALDYWVLPAAGTGCIVAGVENWSRDGRLVSSSLWRNDPATLKIPGAMEFPPDLYPNISIPIDSFFRALEAQGGGGIGKVNLQVSPYTYITLDTWREGIEQLKTEDGTLIAQKVAVRPDVATILPSWPSALRAAVGPFFPKLMLHYDDAAPHDLIEFHGTMGWPAPAVDLQLTRRYVSGQPTQSASVR